MGQPKLDKNEALVFDSLKRKKQTAKEIGNSLLLEERDVIKILKRLVKLGLIRENKKEENLDG